MTSSTMFFALAIFFTTSQISFQVPLQQFEFDEHPDPFSSPNEYYQPGFGQRLKPLLSSSHRRFKNKVEPSSIAPSTSAVFVTSTIRPSTLLEDGDSIKQRSLFAVEPITVNRTEGACTFEGKIYRSGDNIERKHLCHFCFCRNGYIDCYWKNCPPAPEGCIELMYEGVCERSLYLCPIPKKTKVPSLSRTRRQIANNNNTAHFGCVILGVRYRIGELVGVATDPCLECRCALDALYCSPKCCFQPAEPDDDVAQQIQRSDGHKPLQHNPLQHLRSNFEDNTSRR